MGQAKNKQRLDAMGYDGRLQYYADEVVKDAEYLINLKAANWQKLEFPDGTERIALIFNAGLWELTGDNKLVLKNE